MMEGCVASFHRGQSLKYALMHPSPPATASAEGRQFNGAPSPVEGKGTLYCKRRRLSRLRRLSFQIRRIPKRIRSPESPQQLGHIRAIVAPGVRGVGGGDYRMVRSNRGVFFANTPPDGPFE